MHIVCANSKDNQILTEICCYSNVKTQKNVHFYCYINCVYLLSLDIKEIENLQVLNKGVHMEKLVVFPLNNDTEILIKGLKENKL